MSEPIQTKRVYEPYNSDDGTRVLVERLWPRGITHERLHADTWLREIAPTAALRTWYAHDPAKWPEFVTRYTVQLDSQPDLVASLLEIARRGPLTLVYAARDMEHSSALVLLNYLKDRLKTR
ncbi:DUF488 family protein [Candidatus Cryosericum hinesii]|jgi:uncharacterized protein YeaO (DUF488 family)|uniref:DUF488 family protein n=1 Tax=Candidatus Cryosericum hinesii TaxID=2290915 RepID=A0A398DG52_9BACT|nr:DUF488 family protein [Candidatus Cryosericum hinesii]RIE10551.1 DUF488 family protein [Candidatus Cryosericum hinesii]RIE14492.1 DUF488 family protein [Candidatus Cryosericum hinesii]RIE14797.1 DUF488 family protein [Candidatus Cryosericum hinesii]